jgi:tight adherence protein B
MRYFRLVSLSALIVALAVPAASTAGVRLRGVDASAFPKIRATFVASGPVRRTPVLLENGQAVTGLVAESLGRNKSVALAIDTSRSMSGAPIVHAALAARSFVAAKRPSDRIALFGFGDTAVQLSRFSGSTIDADAALRTLSVDERQGTALYDAVVAASRALAAEEGGGHVIVLLTDGKNVAKGATEQEAIEAAHKAGAVVYPIGVGNDVATDSLQRMARETGGSFYASPSAKTLRRAYAAVAAELQRTWRLEYFTTARPGNDLHLEVAVPGLGKSSADAKISSSFGSGPADDAKPTRLLPAPFYGKVGDLLVTLAVALLVLAAGALAFTAATGSWLKSRLAPHVDATRNSSRRRKGRERLAMFAGLFGATERAFGHRSQWRRLELMIERGDLPLKAVEFAWLSIACAFGLGLAAAITGRSSMWILAFMAMGALAPYAWVSFKARRRVRAFENQLPDLLITMAASLKAGHSFKQGIQSVVDEGQEPAAKEFTRVLNDTRLGRPMDEALAETAERIGSKNFSFVITAVNIQRQVGGSLAGLFDMVADTVRQRQQFARKIRSLTAMGRASAYVLIGLPFFVALAITVMNPTYMDPLYHSSTGHTLIFIGLGMMAFGSMALKKIVSFKG